MAEQSRLPSPNDRLANPAWHSLRGPLSDFSESSPDGRAMRFQTDVSFFAGVDEINSASWTAQAELVGREGISVLFRENIPSAPDGWTELFRHPCFQMIATNLPKAPPLDATLLGAADADEVMALVELTDPGPFLPRTLEIGNFLGVRKAGRLVAMAGRRFHLPGYGEISSVCSHPDVRRQGLGEALTLIVANQIHEAGETAILHVLESNENAIALYRRLGFEVSRTVDVVGNQWQSPPRPSKEQG
jgi:predicted GNAT family acetyltransferase